MPRLLSKKTKVADILDEKHIILLPEEKVTPDANSTIGANGKIIITEKTAQEEVAELVSAETENKETKEEKTELNIDMIAQAYNPITEQIVVETVAIPFETVTKNVSDGAKETKNQVLQEGKEGKREVTYRVKYQNEVEIDRKEINSVVIEEPVNKIIQVKAKQVTSRGSSLPRTTGGNSSGTIYKITAYCPCSKCCGKATGRTASGTKATPGRTVAESWTTVCELMEKDSIQEVSQLKELIKRARGNHNEISWGARRMKIYPLIRDRYLPRLRRVEYFYEYSELRTLNKDEIDALYKKDPQKLTASEFWSYIMSQKDATDEKREALYREALSIHPDLMIAANNLASLLIKQNRADTTLLKPFITQDAPSAILVNQTVAYLQKRDFKRANHFAELLPDNKDTEIVKALAAAMDGKYQEAYPIFEKQGGINQAILLLSMKQNSKAWEVLKKVEDTSPDTEYVKAIAANRLNNVNEAVIHLRNAITQKPSLKEIAQKDGDVLDLLDLLDLDKK